MTLADDLVRMTGAGTAEYTLGGTTYWHADQLGSILADNRTLYQSVALDFLPRRYGGGSIEYRRARLPQMWGSPEPGTTTASGTIQDSQGGTVTGWTISKDGYVEFTADQGGSVRYYTGYLYDVNAAAADVLDSWAAAVKGEYDFSTAGDSFSRSQKVAELREQARGYRAKSLVRSVDAVRTDSSEAMTYFPGGRTRSVRIPEGLGG